MHVPLPTETITTGDTALDLASARLLADEAARRLLDEPICLSWYDRRADRECPAHANECQHASGVPGFIEYAANRGAELQVVVDGGSFIFCYRPIGEFAES